MDMRFFDYGHLTDEDLQAVSRVVHDAAWWMWDEIPDGPEKSAGLRKLLEAKDCFVRATLPPKSVEDHPPVAWTHIPRPCTRNLAGIPCDCGQCTHIRNVRKNAK
jgi:hypothetical protein